MASEVCSQVVGGESSVDKVGPIARIYAPCELCGIYTKKLTGVESGEDEAEVQCSVNSRHQSMGEINIVIDNRRRVEATAAHIEGEGWRVGQSLTVSTTIDQ